MIVILLVAAVLAESFVKKIYPNVSNYDPPESFDLRIKYGDAILPVRDQGTCGGSWAMSVADNVGDYLGIQKCSRGPMSAQEIISCDTKDKQCKKGGTAIGAWLYILNKVGLATDDCIPYKSQNGTVPNCPSHCANGTNVFKTQLDGAYQVGEITEESIQISLINYGPLVSYMDVYQDFKDYTGGIYQHKQGKVVGGLYMNILGWGIENDVKFWIGKNVWGTGWGEKGYFRILRGTNESNCESEITYGIPICKW